MGIKYCIKYGNLRDYVIISVNEHINTVRTVEAFSIKIGVLLLYIDSVLKQSNDE